MTPVVFLVLVLFNPRLDDTLRKLGEVVRADTLRAASHQLTPSVTDGPAGHRRSAEADAWALAGRPFGPLFRDRGDFG